MRIKLKCYENKFVHFRDDSHNIMRKEVETLGERKSKLYDERHGEVVGFTNSKMLYLLAHQPRDFERICKKLFLYSEERKYMDYKEITFFSEAVH